VAVLVLTVPVMVSPAVTKYTVRLADKSRVVPVTAIVI
jgi:hypothetical protein